MTEDDVLAIAGALGMSAEPLIDGEQEDCWGQSIVATLPPGSSPPGSSWWLLNHEDDSLFVALGETGELYVSRSAYRVPGPEPILFVEPSGTKLVASREEALEEARRILRNRRRSYRRCHFCREKTPPEWGERDGFGDEHGSYFVCHGCMSKELGVVF